MEGFTDMFGFLSVWFEELVAMFGRIQAWFEGLDLGE